MNSETFVELLKKHTNIDDDFINTFFKAFQPGHELDFCIMDVDAASYLNLAVVKRKPNFFDDIK
jgi:hypothetical protein